MDKPDIYYAFGKISGSLKSIDMNIRSEKDALGDIREIVRKFNQEHDEYMSGLIQLRTSV